MTQEKEKDILAQAVEQIRNCPIPSGPSEELLQTTLNRLATMPPQLKPQLKAGRIRFMKNTFKFAAAAMILIAAVLSLTLFDKTLTPVYAIEQTIKALQQIKTVHAKFIGDKASGNAVCEVWVKINPNTGENESFCLEDPLNDTRWIKTPEKNYTLERKTNRVIFRPTNIGNIFHFGRAMEYITKISDKYTVQEQIDERTGKKILVVSATLSECPIKAYIDPDTKLLLYMEGNGLDGIHAIEIVSYDQPLPSGIFDMPIPQGAEVVENPAADPWEATLRNPAYGMALPEGVSLQDGARQLVTDYWNAMIKEDYQTAQRLRPSPDGPDFWKMFHDEMPPVELVEVGIMEEYGWQLCRVKFTNDQILDLKMFIYLRKSPTEKAILISAMQVQPKK